MPRNIYRLADGAIVPGVTTITNQLDKPALLNWAWRLGQEGKDWREERDSAGDIGTNVHNMILGYLKGEEVAATCEEEERSFDQFLVWQRWKLTTLLLEHPLVSEKLRFGGQFDYYGYVEDDLEIVDFKTGSFDHKNQCFYETVRYQLAGYKLLLQEHGFKVKRCRGVYLPKDGSPVVEEVMTDLRAETRIFKHLLGIYYAKQACKGRK